MKSLIDYKKNVCNIRDECVHIMKENCFDTLANSLKNDTDAIFKKNSPSIMFYGLYNAGKSSIINAIFGKEIASIGDIPTTREVQEIFWDNFIIVDTPGINANNEHTIVTEHEISKHDIILFVLDDMSIEEKSFYSAFLKVLKQNKPVLIVINKKNVEQDHSNIDKLKNRIIENIRTEGTDKNINNIENYKNFYGIITVNALIGYNAKICKDVSSAEVLYNLSGLEDLTITMQKVLNNSNGVKQLLPAIDIIESSITKCNQSLTNRLQSNAQKNYTNSFERVKRQENNLYKRLINEGKNQIRIFSDSISKNISNSGTNSITSKEINDKLINIIFNGFKDIDINLQQQLDIYNVNIPQINSLNTFKSTIPLADFEDLDNNSSFDFNLDMLTEIPPIWTENPKSPILILKIIANILTLFKSKQHNEDNHRKLIKEIEEHNIQVENQVNEMISKIVEVNNKIHVEMFKLEECYEKYVSKLIEQSFEPIYASLKNELDLKEQSNLKLQEYINSMNKYLTEIQRIKMIISS